MSVSTQVSSNGEIFADHFIGVAARVRLLTDPRTNYISDADINNFVKMAKGRFREAARRALVAVVTEARREKCHADVVLARHKADLLNADRLTVNFARYIDAEIDAILVEREAGAEEKEEKKEKKEKHG